MNLRGRAHAYVPSLEMPSRLRDEELGRIETSAEALSHSAAAYRARGDMRAAARTSEEAAEQYGNLSEFLIRGQMGQEGVASAEMDRQRRLLGARALMRSAERLIDAAADAQAGAGTGYSPAASDANSRAVDRFLTVARHLSLGHSPEERNVKAIAFERAGMAALSGTSLLEASDLVHEREFTRAIEFLGEASALGRGTATLRLTHARELRERLDNRREYPRIDRVQLDSEHVSIERAAIDGRSGEAADRFIALAARRRAMGDLEGALRSGRRAVEELRAHVSRELSPGVDGALQRGAALVTGARTLVGLAGDLHEIGTEETRATRWHRDLGLRRSRDALGTCAPPLPGRSARGASRVLRSSADPRSRTAAQRVGAL